MKVILNCVFDNLLNHQIMKSKQKFTKALLFFLVVVTIQMCTVISSPFSGGHNIILWISIAITASTLILLAIISSDWDIDYYFLKKLACLFLSFTSSLGTIKLTVNSLSDVGIKWIVGILISILLHVMAYCAERISAIAIIKNHDKAQPRH